MIKINLLPSEFGGKRGASGKKKSKAKGSGALTPFVLVLAVLLGGAGFYGWTLYDKAMTSRKNLADAKATLAKLDKQIEERNEEFLAQNAEAQEIEEKFAVVQALNPANRLFWSEKLNQLSLAKMKAAVFLTRISMSERVEELETPESKARRDAYEEKKKSAKPGEDIGPAPNVIKIPVIYQTLTVEAIAYGKNSPQQLRQITLFMDTLKKLKWTRQSGTETSFLDGFSPDFHVLPQLVGREGDVDVLRFGFRLEAVPQMSTVDQKPSGAAPKPPGTPAA